MTVSTETARNDYIGTGAVDEYDFTFEIYDETDLLVTVRDTDNAETTLSYPVDYSVDGVRDANGGTITLTAGNLEADYALTIRFRTALTQETDLRNQGAYFPEAVEDVVDRLTKIDQQHKDEIDRCIKLGETAGAVSGTIENWSAGAYVRVNVTEDGLEAVSAVNDPGSYTASGAGAVSRLISAKLGESLSVDDYGTIQQTVTKAETSSRPQSVFIPAKSTPRVLSTTVELTGTKINAVRGDSRRGSVLDWQGAVDTPIINYGVGSTGNMDFARLELWNSTAVTGITGIEVGEVGGGANDYLMVDFDQIYVNGLKKGIALYGADEVNISRTMMFGQTEANSVGVELNEVCSNVNLVSSHIMGLNGTAFTNTTGGSRYLLDGNTVQGNTSGFKGFIFDAADAVSVISNYCESQHAAATGPFIHINTTNVPTANMGGGFITGNHIDAANAAGFVGIKVEHTAGVIVGGNTTTAIGTAIQFGSTATACVLLPNAYGTGTTTKFTDSGVDTLMLDPQVGYCYMPHLLLKKQPSFLAKRGSVLANATGDGTAVSPVIFDTEVYDRGAGGNYDSTTGIYTVPATGIYEFEVTVQLTDVAAGHTTGLLEIVTTAYNFPIANLNVGAIRSAANEVVLHGKCRAPMTANDTARVRLTVSGATKVIDIYGDANPVAYSHFSGQLVA